MSEDKSLLNLVSVSGFHSTDPQLGIVQICPQFDQQPRDEEDPELLTEKAILVISNNRCERLNMWTLAIFCEHGKNLNVEEAGKCIQHGSNSVLYRYRYINDPFSERPRIRDAE